MGDNRGQVVNSDRELSLIGCGFILLIMVPVAFLAHAIWGVLT